MMINSAQPALKTKSYSWLQYCFRLLPLLALLGAISSAQANNSSALIAPTDYYAFPVSIALRPIGDKPLVSKPTTPNSRLLQAAEKGDMAKLKAALAAEANINTRDKQGETPLLVAAASGQTEIVRLLLARGADVNTPEEEGFTPLMAAIGNTKTNQIMEEISNSPGRNKRN